MLRYLVTGGAGFVGSHLAISLARSGTRVRILDNFAAGLSKAELTDIARIYGDLVEVVEGDIRDEETCRLALEGISHVLHHAGISSAAGSTNSPVQTMQVNVVGTANLLQASIQSGTVERFINASSCTVYGDGPSASKSESAMLHPTSVFAISMQAAEKLCENFFKTYKLSTCSLRYFNIYGPSELLSGRHRSAVSRFVDGALNGRDIVVHGNGSQTRDFLHIDDAVSMALHVAQCEERLIAGQTYNIGAGAQTSLIELLDIVEAESGCKLSCISETIPPHTIKYSKADMIKARSVLNFAAPISLTNGVRSLIDAARSIRKAA